MIGAIIALVVADVLSAAITAIQSITTPNNSTMSFQITETSSGPEPCAQIILRLNHPALSVSMSSVLAFCFIPSEATIMNVRPKASAAATYTGTNASAMNSFGVNFDSDHSSQAFHKKYNRPNTGESII